MSNAVLENIHQLLVNLVQNFNISTQTYVDKDELWMGILASSEFEVCSTTNRQKCQSSVQLIFGRDMIISIKYTMDWELICQQKQTQIIKDKIHKNRHRVEYDYKVGDDIMINKHTA